jgi:serine/threonine protein kinase
MADAASRTLEQYLGGELTLAEAQAALRAAVEADPAAVPGVLAGLEQAFRAGRLPVQVHSMLKSAVGAPATEAGRDDTRPITGAPFVEPTNLDPMSAARREAAEPTRLDPGRTDADATAGATTRPTVRTLSLKDSAPATTASAAAAPFDIGEPSAQPSQRAPTGSNWAHPEEWQARHEGPLGPGSVIKDRFELESEIGHGGMGVVYRAIDRRKLEAQDRDPYVAIKILNEEFRRHPSSLIALQREARKAQQLAHPNIITVYDFDRDGTTVYMTMELLDGQPLGRLIAAHKLRGLPLEEALPLLHGLGEALAYAHKKGIVHSDFKPGNAFVTRAGDVKVLDFGIARAVPTTLRPDADRTVFDARELGALTPPYASAEMLAGAAPVPADDVYALAIVAFELLAGRHPFDRVPASTARERNMRPLLPPGLSRRQRRALLRGLEFERDKRHPDARAFLADFEGPGPVRKAAYGTAAAALLVAAFATWQSMQLRPDVPWESLSSEDQQRFNFAVTEGRSALDFNAPPEEALDFFDQAYAIHRNNPRAIEGLEEVADRLLLPLRNSDARDQRRVLQALTCQEYLATYRPVRAACESLLGSSCAAARLPPC